MRMSSALLKLSANAKYQCPGTRTESLLIIYNIIISTTTQQSHENFVVVDTLSLFSVIKLVIPCRIDSISIDIFLLVPVRPYSTNYRLQVSYLGIINTVLVLEGGQENTVGTT